MWPRWRALWMSMLVPPGATDAVAAGSTVGAGTSASAPVCASLLGTNQRSAARRETAAFHTPLLHQNNLGTQGFTDIVSGNNASFPNPGKGTRPAMALRPSPDGEYPMDNSPCRCRPSLGSPPRAALIASRAGSSQPPPMMLVGPWTTTA